MKREDVISLVIYFFMIAIAVIVGLTTVGPTIEQASIVGMNPFLAVILIILGCLLLNIIGLELLHMLGAKLGGYKIISVNFLGICFEKREGKTKVCLKDFDGLTGETKIAPKSEKVNLKPFVWLPIFAYAVEIAGSIVLYTSITNGEFEKNIYWLAIVAILLIIISSMLALYNLVPFKLDSMTDGYRLALLSNPVNAEAYNEFLRVEDLEREGKDVDDIKIYEEITEFTANLNLFAAFENLKKEKYEDANIILKKIIDKPEKISNELLYVAIAQYLYTEVFLKPTEELKKTYNEMTNDKIRRFIANDNSPESIRAYILIAGCIEESQGEVEYALSRLTKARKKVPENKLRVEEALIDKTLKKLYEIHPEWKKENTAN